MILSPTIQGSMTACDLTLSWRADELSAEYRVQKQTHMDETTAFTKSSGWVKLPYDALMAVITLFVNGEAPVDTATLFALAQPYLPKDEDLRCIP